MDIATEFLEWWRNPRERRSFRAKFREPIRYSCGPHGLLDEDALERKERALAPEDVRLESSSPTDTGFRLVVLFRDPVTMLRHRATITARLESEQLAHVDEYVEIVQ